MSRPRFIRVALFLLLLSGSVAYAQQTVPSPAPQLPAEAAFTFSKIDLDILEKCRQLDHFLESKGLLYSDSRLGDYISDVGRAVLPRETPENVVWRFRVVRDPMPNAFALPNGSIYVHSGLLARLENEAQLASVLAHEARHVLGHHGYLENRSYRKKMVAIHILAAASSVAGSIGGTWGSLISAVVGMVPSIVVGTMYGYSRELERESDLKAFTALNDAEYSTEEMPNAFRQLKKSYEVELVPEPTFYRSHPKLDERIAYISELVNTTRPKTPHPKVEAERYTAAVERAVRHNINLDIQEGNARTAVGVSRQLVKLNSSSPENFLVLGDALRALGPHSEQPTPEELTSKEKKQTRKMLGKMTLDEYEAALMQQPEGKAAWQGNRKSSEDAYRKALELEPDNARAYRGLGFLCERDKQPAEAAAAFRKYLELTPTSTDRAQIERRLAALEQELARPTPTPPNL